ncbi:carbohydrate ABC transporter permease [Paenibacillaceae bacterium WGS1546]|uniref:carbohydrate ABC transporter permease n=1 Tax=Cohnella sp. WGS1546 TaxID=3366810 RepID=UPI00372D6AB2
MHKPTAQKMVIDIVFIGPMLLLFSIFIMLPFVRSIIYSFQDWNGISSVTHWVGWENYVNLLKDANFARTLSFSLKYAIATVLAFNSIGLLLAVALNMGLRTRNLLRTAFFLPTVMGILVVGYLWNFIIKNVFPLIGDLTGFEIFRQNWFVSPDYAFWAIVLVTLWQGVGYYIIIYLAGLQGVPNDLVEAAQIDGAGRWTRFWTIILPLIRPSLTICLFLSIVNGFKSFDINFSLTMGGPFGTTESISYQIYQDAFNKDMFSYASAKAVVFFLVLALLSVIQVAAMKRKEVEA